MSKPKPKSATQLPGGAQVLKFNSTGSMRQARCPHCHGMCSPQVNARGDTVTVCAGCKRQFTMKRL